jgi:hypothetical protein
MLRANTRGAAHAFAEQMRNLEAVAPMTRPDRVVSHDHAADRQPLTLTSELTLDRP